jgi:hypothetical protein
MNTQLGNKWIFEVEFDCEAWPSLTELQKQNWLDDVTESINEHARVSHLTIKGDN